MSALSGFGDFQWRGCGPDGTPHNPKHPWNDGGPFIPRSLPTPAIPVHMVCGPAGVGKTTFVRRYARPGDITLDLDDIKSELAGVPVHSAGEEWVMPALEDRNRRLRALAEERGREAWLIIGVPDPAERLEWRALLGRGRLLVLLAPERVCLRRCLRDPERIKDASHWGAIVARWFRRYRPSPRDETVDAA